MIGWAICLAVITMKLLSSRGEWLGGADAELPIEIACRRVAGSDCETGETI